MGTTTRSFLTTGLPWLALAAVTVFALIQVRARRELESTAPPSPASPEVAAPAAVPTSPRPAAHDREALSSADAALDEALQDLAAARTRVVELEAAAAVAVERARTAEARLDVSQARLLAAEKDLDAALVDVERLDGLLVPLQRRVQALEERRAVIEDPVLRTLTDVVAEDPARRRRAREASGRLTAEDLARLAALVSEDGSRVEAALGLLGSVAPSEEADGVVLAVLAELEADGDAASRLQEIGAPHLTRGALLGRLLGDSEAAAWHPALLVWLGRHASGLDDAARSALAPPLAAKLASDAPGRAAAARLIGILRQDGSAEALAALLGAADDDLRASAAYALSRVPDRDAVRLAAWNAVVALLADEALEVRTAGLLLAESILGRALEFDPAADEATRREQLKHLPATP